MNINDYVRTNRGIIAKIIKVNSTGSIICDRSVYYGFNIVNTKRILKDFSSIVKSSPNITDLIEVGDYVNGFLVIHKENDYVRICPAILPLDLKENDIKSIVTHEQFSQMEYKVGE